MKKVNKVKEQVKNVADRGTEVVKSVEKIKLIDEFKTFISRGNVLDLAVGVIVGGAFQKLVTSLTDNIISPILGCFTEADFTDYVLKIGNLELKYGAFFTDIINFIIMAFIVFLIVKFMNKILMKKEKVEEKVEKPVVESDEVKILKEIRDLLKEKEEN